MVEKELTPYNVLNLVRATADENGIIKRELVHQKILQMGKELDVDSVMEEIESQGLIIRIGLGIWQFLE